MVSLETPNCEFGSPAPDFQLLDENGKSWSREQCAGSNGLLVMFICNHCPYVKAILDRIVHDTAELRERFQVNSVAIMSNDPDEYAEDAYDKLRVIARRHNFSFPYLIDDTQTVAKQYGAVCTPDFFGYNADMKLQYRGRLDASGRQQSASALKRDLFEAMREVAQSGICTQPQVASIGCSIKWKQG